MSNSSANEIWRWVRHIGAIALFGLAIYFLLKLAFPYGINSGSIDIQLHDTYFVFPLHYISLLIVAFIYTLGAFVYQLFAKWKNSIVNWTQLSLLGWLIYDFLGTIIGIWPLIKHFLSYSNDSSFYLSDSYLGQEDSLKEITGQQDTTPWFTYILITILFALPILYLLYCIYRTIKNYKLSKASAI